MWKEINYWLQVAIRSILGGAVLPYGVSKLLALQFQVPAFQYTRPLGEVPSTYLTWAFLGYAPWLQILLVSPKQSRPFSCSSDAPKDLARFFYSLCS